MFSHLLSVKQVEATYNGMYRPGTGSRLVTALLRRPSANPRVLNTVSPVRCPAAICAMHSHVKSNNFLIVNDNLCAKIHNFSEFWAKVQFSDLYVHDADYLRIANVTLGYDLSRIWKSKYCKQLRVYVQAQNLLTFTKYKGMDPEIGYGTDGWVSGVDVGYYPRPRTFLIGANVKF